MKVGFIYPTQSDDVQIRVSSTSRVCSRLLFLLNQENDIITFHKYEVQLTSSKQHLPVINHSHIHKIAKISYIHKLLKSPSNHKLLKYHQNPKLLNYPPFKLLKYLQDQNLQDYSQSMNNLNARASQ